MNFFHVRFTSFVLLFFVNIYLTLGASLGVSVSPFGIQAAIIPGDTMTLTPKQTARKTEEQKKEIVGAMLNSQQLLHNHTTVIGGQEWQDFDIATMVDKLDRSLTAFGSWGLRYLINPIKEIDEIKRRQTIIALLVHDASVRLPLIKLLKEIKDDEQEIISYWDEHDTLHAACQGLYYSIAGSYTQSFDNYLNGSRMALENSALVDLGKNVAALGSLLGTAGLLNEAVSSALNKRPYSVRKGLVEGLLQPIRVHTLTPAVYKNGYEEGRWAEALASGTAGDYYKSVHEGWGWPMPIALCATAGYIVGNDFMFALNVRDALRRVHAIHQTHNSLQERMTQISRFFKSIEKVYTLINTYIPACKNNELPILGAFLHDSPHENESLCALYDLLKKATFDEPANYFYSRGRVLLANKTMHDNKAALIPVLQMLSLIDAYVSIATLVDENKYNDARFCFAEFGSAEKPYIAADSFWTPLMPAHHVVLNSIEWGNGGATSNIVLTGPNGVGKSTIMKALGACIVLAQSWGIAPAHGIKLAPFTGVCTSFMQRENLQQNMSTFMAEKIRIDAITSFIRTYQAGDRYFVLLDEPYRGTIETEAARLIWLVGRDLVHFPHTMLVMATHLEKPIHLAEETTIFANYQLEIIEVNGRFGFTYKLIPGAAHWWFNDLDRRARFVDQLLANKGFA